MKRKKEMKKIVPQNSPGSAMTDYDYAITTFLLGSGRVGKSGLLARHSEEKEKSFPPPPFTIVNHKIGDITVKNQIYDTVYYGKFNIPKYSAHAAIIAFDLTDKVTFNNVTNWLNDDAVKGLPIVLVGTKCDDTSNRVVEEKDIQQLRKNNKMINCYVETSAKNNINVDLPFLMASDLVIQNFHKKFIDNKKNNEEKNNPKQFSLRNVLIKDLDKYIKRIESHKNTWEENEIDFSHGFRFFKKSRAANREANYHLAQELQDQLNNYKDLSEIFSDISNLRKSIIKENKIYNRPDFVERGINSSEIKSIIKKANSFIKKESAKNERTGLTKKN